MNISRYTTARVENSKKAIINVTQQITDTQDRWHTLQANIQKVESAKKSALAAGLSVNSEETEAKMKELNAQLSKLDAELIALKDTQSTVDAARAKLKPLEELCDLCETRLGSVEIPELASALALISSVQAELLFEQHEARGCRLWLGDRHRPVWQVELLLVSAVARVRRGVVPEDLMWVPKEWLPVVPTALHASPSERVVLIAAPELKPSQIYYIADEDRFRALTPSIGWTESETRDRNLGVWNSPRDEVRVAKEAAWGAPEDALTERLSETFKNKSIDLDTLSDDAFLAALAEKVRAATQPAGEVIYAATGSQQTNAEIEQEIGGHIRAFIAAPWTKDTRGMLANFKYYCEQGERLRMHNLSVVGAYGFRLRTRDHSWIKGSLYVVPENLPSMIEAQKVPEVRDNYGSSALVRLGRLILKVAGESRD